jgi:hypothetical protein
MFAGYYKPARHIVDFVLHDSGLEYAYADTVHLWGEKKHTIKKRA